MKKRICKILAMILGAATVMGTTGITVMADDTVTLTVWGDPDNQAVIEPVFEKINAAFEEAHPNIKIDYQWSGSFDNINVATQSDSLPDLFWVQGNKSTKWRSLQKTVIF